MPGGSAGGYGRPAGCDGGIDIISAGDLICVIFHEFFFSLIIILLSLLAELKAVLIPLITRYRFYDESLIQLSSEGIP